MSETLIFPEQTIEGFTYDSDAGFYLIGTTAPFAPKLGKTYRVVWDGNEYICKAYEGDYMQMGSTCYYLGNEMYLTGQSTEIVEPFVAMYIPANDWIVLVATDAETSHTIAVYEVDEETESEDTTKDGNNIVLYDRTGAAVVYEGVETLTTDTTVEGERVTFTRGVLMQDAEIELSMAAGNQEVSVPDGYLIKKAVLKKPETLSPENIKKNVDIAGVIGEFGGMEKEVTVELSMKDGDQVIAADEETVFKKVTVKKPKELKPGNVVTGVNIGEVVGTMPFEFTNDKKIVVFYDYDGTVIEAYILETDEIVTELPKPPQHDGLVFAGWNHSVESINDNKIGLDVGAMYCTDDGATRLYMDIPYDSFLLYLNFSQSVANGVTIDWGDGVTDTTDETVGYIEMSHTYENAGEYIIRLNVHDGCDVILGNKSKGEGLFYDSNGTGNTGTRYLTKVQIGNGISLIDSGCFMYAYSMQSITIPPNVEMEQGNTFYFTKLKFVVYPIGCKIAYFGTNRYLKGTSLSETIEYARVELNSACMWNHLILPNNVKTGYVYAYGNTDGMVDYIVLGTGLESLTGTIQYAKKIWSFSEKVDVLKIIYANSTQGNLLEEVYIAEGSISEVEQKGIFYSRNLKKCVLPKSVKKIGADAFMFAEGWEDGIPDDNNVEIIEGRAFYNCGIKRLILPRIKSMGYIMECYDLQRVKFSNKLTTFAPIRSCHRLKELTIPHGVTILQARTWHDDCKVPNATILGDDLVIEELAFNATSTNVTVLQWLDVFCKTKIVSISSKAFNYAYVRNLIIRKKDAFLTLAGSLINYSGAKTVYVPAALYDAYSSYCTGKTLKKIEENFDVCGKEAVMTYDAGKESYMDLSKNYYTLMNSFDYDRTEETIDTGVCCSFMALDRTKFARIEKVEVK